jgi:hypothetical protein
MEEGWGGWAAIVALRTIPFGLNHALFTGLTGAGLGMAYLSRKPWVKLLALPGGLAAGMLFHSLHNLGATLVDMNCLALCGSFVLDWGGILMLGVLVSLVWRQEREWMVEHLAGEVTDEVFQTVTSWKSWRSARWGALMRGDIAAWRELRRLRQAATELAFNKRKLAQRGQAPVIQKDIDRYRLQLAELGAARGLDVNEG